MMKPQFATDLVSILVSKNAISEKEAQAMESAFADSASGIFEDFLLEEHLVDEIALLEALSDYYQAPSFDVNGYFFDTFFLRKFPKGFLLRNGIIPLESDNESMTFVASNPADPNLPTEIGRFVSYNVYFYVGIRRAICNAVKEYYDVSDTETVEESEIIFEEDQDLFFDDFDYYQE
jgi:hypothetical protein